MESKINPIVLRVNVSNVFSDHMNVVDRRTLLSAQPSALPWDGKDIRGGGESPACADCAAAYPQSE